MFRYRTDDGQFCDLETYAAEVCGLRWDQDSELETHAALYLAEQAPEYDSGVRGAWRDTSHGCASGIVGHLIYYRDTLAFYAEHAAEIGRMLGELCNECGCTPGGLFGDRWDDSDPMALDTTNQNLLAWFGFEEAARRVACQSDLD